jgi:hypothetical protein
MRIAGFCLCSGLGRYTRENFFGALFVLHFRKVLFFCHGGKKSRQGRGAGPREAGVFAKRGLK